MSLRPNCINRGGPAEKIRPKFDEFRSATGSPKFAWFATLKTSARSCSRVSPGRWKSRTSDTSTLVKDGPRAMLRPALPNWPACVWMSRRRNADRLSHSFTVCGPAFGSPIRLGRLAGKPDIGGLFACSDTFAESDTVKGVPELCVAMVFSCHPRAMACTAAGARADTGGIQLALATRRWRASKSDGPYSASRSNGFCARSFSPASGFAAAPERFIADRWSFACEYQYATLKPTPAPNRRDRLN